MFLLSSVCAYFWLTFGGEHSSRWLLQPTDPTKQKHVHNKLLFKCFFLRSGVVVADSHNIWIEENEGSSTWFALACVQPGSCSRLLFQEAQQTTYWPRGCGGISGCLPSSGGMSARVCVCVYTHLLFSSHKTSIMISLALYRNVWQKAAAVFTACFSPITLKRKKTIKHTWNYASKEQNVK